MYFRPVPLVFSREDLIQPCLFERDHDVVNVGNGKGQENDGPRLFQQSSLSEVSEYQTYIHGIAGEAIWSPRDELR